VSRLRPSRIPEWPRPFDPDIELDWGEPEVSRRLLLEHLDESHDGASRRPGLVAAHIRRLLRLLPPCPARILDAGCGPGLYAVPLAQHGFSVVGVDAGDAVLAHARTTARRARAAVDFVRADLRALPPGDPFDAAILIYFVLDSFTRRDQLVVLRRLYGQLRPQGRLIAELRVRPDQPPGRLTSWDVVPRSLLSDRPHLLLVDTTYDDRNHTFVLRETAVFDDGRTASQQTTSRLFTLDEIQELFARAGFAVRSIHDGWTRYRANALSDSLLHAWPHTQLRRDRQRRWRWPVELAEPVRDHRGCARRRYICSATP